MGKISLCAIVALFAVASAANAVQLPTIHMTVTTGQASYNVGDTVTWKIFAWGDCLTTEGIALLKADLVESQAATLSPAQTTGSGVLKNLTNSLYNVTNGFFGNLTSAGTPTVSPGGLNDIHVTQTAGSQVYEIGNDGNSLNEFAQGSFLANVGGSHTLSLANVAANYWSQVFDPNTQAAQYNAQQASGFGPQSLTNAQFTVNAIPEPTTLCLLGLGVAGRFLLRRRS